MGLFDYFKSKKRASLQNPNTPITAGSLLDYGGQGNENTMYGAVTPEVAMRCSAVHACVRVIAETLATIPLDLFDIGPKGKTKAVNDPRYTLVHDNPTPYMSSTIWREVGMNHVLLGGNWYSYILRNGAGYPIDLIPVGPGRIEATLLAADGKKYYQLRGVKELVPDTDMIHIMGMSWDGLTGLSPIHYAKGSITHSLAAEEFGSRFYSQGALPTGVLKIAGKISDLKQMERLRESWEAIQSGLKGAHRTAILEQGTEYSPLGIAPEQAQFLGTRQFLVSEIARWYRVPPHMIGDLSRSTNNNIEQQSLEFVRDTVRPWVVRIEGELNRKLLLPSERGKKVFEFNLDALLRGDAKSRAETYHIMRLDGVLSANEWRADVGLNDCGEAGDVYWAPVNIQSADRLLLPPAEPTEPVGPTDAPEPADAPEGTETPSEATAEQQDEGDDMAARSLSAIVEAGTVAVADALRRLTTKETGALRRCITKAEPFASSAADFYGKHADLLAEAIMPSLVSYGVGLAAVTNADLTVAASRARTYATDFAEAHVASRLKQIDEASDPEAIFAIWQENIWEDAKRATTGLGDIIKTGGNRG